MRRLWAMMADIRLSELAPANWFCPKLLEDRKWRAFVAQPAAAQVPGSPANRPIGINAEIQCRSSANVQTERRKSQKQTELEGHRPRDERS
jgi:hypothetical protein